MENKQIIRQKLQQLSPKVLEIIDESHKHAGHIPNAVQTHFRVKIVSSAFRGLNSVARHRLVYNILKEELKGQVHALALTLLSEEE
jgi:BolA protein